MRLLNLVLPVMMLSLIFGCASAPKTAERSKAYVVKDISKGLPEEGLWRQNAVLADMDGNGTLDIVTSPPRKAKPGSERPFIFVRGSDGNWKEANISFPEDKKYGYGGVAVGDINGDGRPDIVLAVHMYSGNIVTYLSGKGNTYTASTIPVDERFHSRAVDVTDINGDGRPDIVAYSEAQMQGKEKSKGILIAINKGAGEWAVHLIDESLDTFGDSITTGDIDGDGLRDIAVAPLTVVQEKKRIVWLGDGEGKFDSYKKDMIGDAIPIAVSVGDVDGDGRDEIALRLLVGVGKKSAAKLAVYKWELEGSREISSGLEGIKPMAMDLTDVDGDGRKDLIVLLDDGLHILKYDGSAWTEIGRYPLPSESVMGAYGMTAAREKDGSVLVVVNLGSEEAAFRQGIMAFRVTKAN